MPNKSILPFLSRSSILPLKASIKPFPTLCILLSPLLSKSKTPPVRESAMPVRLRMTPDGFPPFLSRSLLSPLLSKSKTPPVRESAMPVRLRMTPDGFPPFLSRSSILPLKASIKPFPTLCILLSPLLSKSKTPPVRESATPPILLNIFPSLSRSCSLFKSSSLMGENTPASIFSDFIYSSLVNGPPEFL